MDQFTFVLNNTATDSVTALVVTLAASGTPYSGIASVEIRGGTTCAGTLYYSAAANPSSNTVNFSGGTAIPVTNATSTYVICITPKTHANMPAVPGALYALSPEVSDYTSSYKSGVNDSMLNTITIDNESPTSATVPLASTSGDTSNTLKWTSSASSDISSSVILRWADTSPGAEVPAEGGTYTAGNTITNATVACVITSAASTAYSKIDGTSGDAGCSTTALTNDQAYSYKVFSKDSRGNYDAGTVLNGSPLTPGVKITISGNLYASNESTAVTSGTVKMSIAGGTAVTTTAGALGAWTFSNVSAPAAGQVVTIWMDSGDTTGATNATLVFKYGTTCEGGTTSCVGLKLYQTKVIIGVDYSNTANSIANSDFAACDNDTGTGCNGDTDIGFTSNLSTTYNLAFTWTTYNVLRIKDANAKFSPAGNVTARQIDLSAGSFTTGSGTISVSATANPLTVSGGSLTISTNNTWIYTGGGMSVVPTYYNLTISGSGFALPSGTINVLNTLSIQTGVTAGGNPNVNTTFLAVTANLFTGSGTWTISGTGTPLTGSASNYTFSNGNTFVYTGNGATIFTDSYFNLELKPNGNSDQVLSSGNIVVSGNLVIGDGTAGHAGATAVANDPMISLSGTLTIAANATFTTSDLASSTFIMSSTTPTVTVNGTLTISTGNTWAYTGNGATILNLAYYNLQLKPSGSSDQVLPSGTLTILGNLTIGDGLAGRGGATGVAGAPNINTVTLTVSANNTFTTGAGIITLSGTGTPFSKLGTLTASPNNIFRYTGNGATITAADYYTLELKPSSSTAQIFGAGTFNIVGNLVIGDGTSGHVGATALANDPIINLAGNLTINQYATFVTPDLLSGVITMSSLTPTVTVNGTLTISSNNLWAFTGNGATIPNLAYYNLKAMPNGSSNQILPTGPINISGTLFIGDTVAGHGGVTGATYNPNVNVSSISQDGNSTFITGSGTYTISAGGTSFGRVLSGSTFTASTGNTFKFTGNGATFSEANYYNLELKPSGSTDQATYRVGTINVAGDLTIGDGVAGHAGAAFTAYNNSINISGTVTIAANATLTTGSGTITMSSATPTITVNGTLTISTNNTWVYTGNGATIPNLAYYNLHLKPSSSSDQVLAAGTLTMLGNLTIGDGTAGHGGATGVAGAPNINTVTLTISANNTFTTGAGIITLSGTGTPFLNSGPMTASTNNTFRYTGNGANVTANNYYNLELKSSGASNLNILTGTVNVAGNLVIGDGVSGHGGATALTSDPTINLSGSLTINQYATFITSDNQARAFTMSSTTPTVTVNGTLTISTNNTWKYTGNGAAIPNLAYYNLQLFSSSSSAQVLPPGTLTVLGAFLVGDGTAGHAGATAATYNTTVTVTGDLSVSANATYTTGTSLLTVGTLTINGTLAHGTGASSLTTGAVTINSGGSWTHSGTGTVTLSGNVTNNSGGIINLNSHGNTAGCGTNDSDDIIITAASAMSWSGTGTYTLVDVTMTNQTTAAGITVYSSSPGSDTSGNSGWTWDNCVAGITISGHVYSNEGTAALTTLPTVAVKVNGAGTYSDAADGAGYFEITNVTVAANNAVTVFLDGATEKATTVTLAANNSSNISLDLYQNRLILRHEGAMAISTIHLNQYDNACNAGTGDTDVVFCATDNDLTVSDGYKLIIWTGKTFEPSGSVTTSPSNDGTDSNVDGDFDIQAGATFTPATTVSIGGDFITTGTSVYSQATAWTFTATATGHSIVTNSYSSLGYVYFNGVGGGWDCDTVMGIDFDFVAGTLSGMCNIIASGSITGSGGIINIDGDVSLSDSVNLTENFGTTTGSSDWAMGNLNVQGAYGSGNQEFHLATGGTGAIIIHSNLVLAGMSGPSDFYAEDRTIVFDAAGWINEGNGTFYAGTSTVKYTSTTPTEISPVTSYYNLEVGTNVDSNAGIVYSITSGYFITVTGTLTIGNASSTNADTLSQAGTLSAGSVVVTSKGIWSNIGTEDVILSGNVSNAGTIIMNSNNGSQCTDGADDIVIKSSNSPDEVNGGGTDRTWTNTGGTITIINVKAVDQAGSITAYTSTLISSGWSAGTCGVTVTGTFYSGEGTGALTTKPISIKVDGAGSFTGNTNGSGVYSISVTGLGAGKVVTVFVDGATEKATTVTRAANASSISGLDLYQNRLIVRHEDAGPITNANLNQYDNACSAGTGDTDVLFCSDGTNMTLSDGFKLIVWTGKTFTPGGTITTSPSADGTDSNVDGDVDIQTSATLTMGTNALSIGGDFALSGTFAPPTGQTVTFTATATGHEINVPTANGGFDNIVFNGAGGGWSMTGVGINVEGDMTVTSGTLSGGGEWYVKGGGITGDGTINLTSGGMRIDGTGNFGGNTNWSFNNLIVGDGTGTETTTATGTGDITVSGVLTISANQTLDAGTKTWTLSGSGTPFVKTGTFSGYNSTLQYTGTSATNLTVGDYNNLLLIPAGTVTYTSPGNISLAGDLVIGNGTNVLTLDMVTNSASFGLRGTSHSLTIAANAIVSSNTNYGFSFSGGSNSITDNTTNKQNLGIIRMNGGDGTPIVTLNSSIKTTYFNMTVGTFHMGSYTMEVTGSGALTNRPVQISGGTTFDPGTGTVSYIGSSATDVETTTYNNLGIGTTSDTSSGVTYSASSIGVNGVLTIGHASSTNSDTLALANYGSLTLNGSGTPFVITSKGSFTAGADSLTMYYGTSATNIAPATYSALLIGVASPSSPVTYSLTGAITAASIQIGNNSGSGVTLEQGSYSVTTSGLLQVTSNGIWRNISTGDLVLGGSLQNSGSVIFNSNNGAQCTDGANDIVITSSTGGTQRDWTGAGTFTIYNVAATDQKSTTSVVTAYTSTLTNTTWTVGSCGISFTGTVYGADGQTALTGTAFDLKLFKNGGTSVAMTSVVSGTGAFSFSGVNVSAGDMVTIWMNTDAGADKATLIMKYGTDCTGNTCSSLPLVKDAIVLASKNGAAQFTNSDLSACNSNTGAYCNDTDIGYTSEAGFSTTRTLKIDTNATFAPGGNVSVGKLNVVGTYTGSTETLTITGAGSSTTCTDATAITLCGAGVFTAPTNTIFSTTSSSNIPLRTYKNLALNSTGTYTAPASDLTLRGNLSIASGATFTKSASNKLIFASGGSQTITDNNGTKLDLGLVQVSANGTNTTLNLGSSVKLTKLTVDALQTLSLNGANTLTILGTGTTTSRPFINNGNFTPSGTIEYVGDGDTTVEALTYNNLNINPTITVARAYGLAGAATINGNLTINPDAATALALTTTLGGNTVVSGNVTVTKANSATATLARSTYALNANKLDIATGGTVTGSGDVTVGKLVVGGTYTGSTETLTITGAGSSATCTDGTAIPLCGAGTFTAPDVTVFNTSSATNIPGKSFKGLTLGPTTSENPTYTIGSSGSYSVSQLLTVGQGANAVTVDNSSGSTITLAGSLVLNSGSTYTKKSVSWDFMLASGTASTITDNTASKQNLGNVLISTNGTHLDLGSDIKVNTMGINCGLGCTLDLNGSHTLTFAGTGTVITDGFANTTFNMSTGTVAYAGTSANIFPLVYNHLSLSGAGTYTAPASDFTVRGNLTIGSEAAFTKSANNKLIFASGGSQTITDSNATTRQDLGAIQISSNTTDTTLNLGSSIKATSVAVDATQTLGLGGNILSLTGATPLSLTGTLDTATSTIEFIPDQASGTVDIPAIAYYNLKTNKANNTFRMASGTQANLNSIDVTAGTLDLNTNDPTIGVNDVTISGTLSASSDNALTVKGTWTNNGTFNNNSGTVTLDPQAWTPTVVTGSSDNIFYDLTSTQTGKYIQFGANKNVRVNNSFSIQGKPYNLIDIDSTTPGQTWLMNLQGTSTLKWVVLRNAGCGAGTLDINLHESVEKGGGNLACWKFIERSAPAAIGTGPGGSGSVGGGTDDGGGTGGTGGGSGGEGGTGGGGAGGGGGGTP